MGALKGIIFVVGASRSGTTMLNRILGKHPSIAAMNELHYFGDLFEFGANQRLFQGKRLVDTVAKLFARYRRGLWYDRLVEGDSESAKTIVNDIRGPMDGKELFYRFIEQVAKETGASLVAEQTPRNIYYAADLLEAYPDARVLHIVRDPRAVIASQKRRWTRRSALNAKNIPMLEAVREWLNYHPYTMSLLWKKAFTAGRGVEASDRYMRVRFEDLVEDPWQVVGRVCGFLGVSFEKGMLEIPQIDSSVRSADNAAVGIQKTAVDSWKNVLSEGEVLLIERLLSGEMQGLGYRDQSCGTGVAYLSLLPIVFKFPFHLLGTILINPQRFLIQLKGVMLRK